MENISSTNISGNIELDLLITSDCNLKCKHCLYTGKSKNKYYLSIEEINKLFDSLDIQNTEIHLLGGEPIVHPNIKEIVSIASSKGLIPKILTNGFALNKNLLSELKKVGLREIGFSIDGTKIQHELNRGKNTYDKVIMGISYSKELGYDVKISTAVHKINKNTISDLIVLLDKEGVKRVLLEHVLPIGRGKQLDGENLNPLEWGDLIDKLKKVKKEKGLKIRIAIQKVFFEKQKETPLNNYCSCISGKMPVIDWNGEYYPCIIFFAADYSFGNIHKDNWNNLNNPKSIYKKVSLVNKLFQSPQNTNLNVLCPAIRILLNKNNLSLKNIEHYDVSMGCFHNVIII